MRKHAIKLSGAICNISEKSKWVPIPYIHFIEANNWEWLNTQLTFFNAKLYGCCKTVCFSNFHFLLKREHINENFLYGETMCEMCNVYT